jgi:hypothetical protein
MASHAPPATAAVQVKVVKQQLYEQLKDSDIPNALKA